MFTPVAKHSTIRILFSLATTFRWVVQQVDINNAFLNGLLNETVFMSQPQGFEDPTRHDHVCLLKKALSD